MNIHEFQAKKIFEKYHIPVLKSFVVQNKDQALKAAQDIGGSSWVLKAQVHAGGRGKGGGVQIAQSLDQVQKLSDEMIGMNLVTAQTGKEGEKVHQILVEQIAQIEKEFYLALLINRETSSVGLIVSSEGGMDIEEVAKKSPEKIVTLNIHPETGLCDYQYFMAASILGLNQNKDLFNQFKKIILALYLAFIKEDMSLLEINPLVLTKDQKLIPLDAKVSLDSNAQFRHPHWKDYPLKEELESAESRAGLQGFSFVRLPGNIGCMVNGAGLAMATMDMIQLFGGEPANFLDVGGDADVERIQTAFKFILEDEKVKGILVNIFGGIVRCDLIASGIIEAAQKIGITLPIVVRLEGNSASEAKDLLKKSNLNIISAKDLGEATQKIISLTLK